jgi:RNA polymerase sigma factor (sigma-70 family)
VGARRAVEAIWRIEASTIIAALARQARDVGLAEEAAQDALVTALERWPRDGVPPNPGGWLMTTAKNRLVDASRRRSVHQQKVDVLGRDLAAPQQDIAVEVLEQLDDYVGDDLLRLICTVCHPVLSMESRVALALRCLAGLSTEEIARAFLIPTATAAQRLVRAKRTLTDAGVEFAMPAPPELSDRLASVLEVVYLMFNEGYSATSGQDWLRPSLCSEAMRLGRVLAGRVPDEPEVHGLLALMELQAARMPARTGPGGAPVLLPDQDRRRWDRLLIRRGQESLARAHATGRPLGPYTVQAAIAAVHARALSSADTDWNAISQLYDVLAHLWPTPVVELNRAVAVSMTRGPAEALLMLDAISRTGPMATYPPLAAVRGDLLERLGRHDEASQAFRHAAELTQNADQKSLFEARADRSGGD